MPERASPFTFPRDASFVSLLRADFVSVSALQIQYFRNERLRGGSAATCYSSMGALSRMNWRAYFPPLSYRSFMRHYLPASGAISHTLFAVHIFNPTFVSRFVVLIYLLGR
ncbi:hypothetical protein Y032_0275g1042 [Ancylostoma ceylanicum]|uniref:Uncharacterized protein n=1 Tax=Ancylostoma ceylanicum TaxID=53326 RepID=A0A016S869_9BILA|nr:hypothetical protein Y032_0275g1042 [Ancylostoma ceylanicum]